MAAAVLLVLAAGAASADTTTVAVSASVSGTCRFATSGTVSFTLDPAAGGTVAGTITQPTFWCTKNQAYNITDDNGINRSGTIYRMKHASLNEYIPYTFTYTAAGTGSGRSSTIAMNIASNVLEAGYIDAAQGSYSDTVTLTILP